MPTVPVYEWLLSNGVGFGCGTRVEFDYWTAQGVNPEGSRCGRIIGYENPSADERRKAQWEAA